MAIKVEPFQDDIVIESWKKIQHPNVLPLIAFLRVEDPTDDQNEVRIETFIFIPERLIVLIRLGRSGFAVDRLHNANVSKYPRL